MTERMKTDSNLTDILSGAVVSHVKRIEDRDLDMIWFVFEDGRVLSIDTYTDEPLVIDTYSSEELARIDSFGTSQERIDAGFV